MRLPMSYYEQNHSGDFMSKLIFDTERASDIYGSRLRRLAAAIISAVVYLIPMFYFSWQLTLCLLAISMVSFVTNSLFVKPMKQAGGRLSTQNGIMTEKLTNILSGMELTKIFPAGPRLMRDYNEANDTCSSIQMKTNKMSAALESLNCLFDLTGALAFLGLGIWFVSKGIVGLGELTAVYAIYGSFRYVFLEIGMYLPQMMNCIANAEKVFEFLDQKEEPVTYLLGQSTQQQNTTPSDIVVAFDKVSFSYQAGRSVLEDFSMQVKKGSCTAVTGASGRGKSTLAKLLLGFYQPEHGEISINGKSYATSNLQEIRQMIGYVPQEPYLYGVSIAENIAYGKSGEYREKNLHQTEVSMEEIVIAAKAANAHEFIMKLPQGYDTIPGERGNKLSGGEKQRIAIARAVLKNAPVLLLDEATSALDNESERLVNEALNRLCKNRTTIMIAHRASTIAMADTIIAMD
jgi:ATP-binding cassette subfamily B protein